MIRTFNKLARPLVRGLRLMVARGTIKLVDDGPKAQTAQLHLLDGEIRDGVEVFQSYGLSTVPHPGSEAVAVSVGGNRDHCIVIAHGDRRYRLTGMAGGEVALHDDQGAAVILRRDGIAIIGGGRDLTISGAPNVHIQGGNLHLDSGDITLGSGDVVAATVSLRHHLTSEVQTGTGVSGEPVA